MRQNRCVNPDPDLQVWGESAGVPQTPFLDGTLVSQTPEQGMVRPARMPRSGLRRGSRQHVHMVAEQDLMRLGRVTAEIPVKISVHRGAGSTSTMCKSTSLPQAPSGN